MIHLTIDNKNIEVPEGTSVLQAARMAEIHIPTLCDHPELIPNGGCRLCNVEVEGFRGPTASCTLPASQNMVVHTDTEALRASRRFILTMLFSERNHFCPFCVVSGGDCELQNAAYEQGMTHWEFQPNWSKFPLDATHPDIAIDHNRCILCRRCIRACGELVGNFTLGLANRGAQTMLVADHDVPLGESTCVSCGMCIQVCPTGALIDRNSAYLGLSANLTKTRTVCIGCSVGCGIEAYTRDNQLVGILGDWESPINSGLTCRLGRFAPMNEDRKRILVPLVRKNGTLQPTSWDEAIETAAHLMRSKDVAAVASTRLSAEALNLFSNLFSGTLGSDMVTSIEEGLPTDGPAKLALMNGTPIEGKQDALDNADCILLVGANPTDRHAVLSFKIKRRRHEGLKLIVIDTQATDMAEGADCFLNPTESGDLDLIQQITQAINSNLEDDSSKASHAAQLLRDSKQILILYGKGVTAQGNGMTLAALQALAKSLNQAELLSVKGEANSLAASQFNLDLPFNLNGHSVVYIAIGDDYINNRLLDRTRSAQHIIVQASYESQATDLADVVLPCATWSEQSGHFVNLDGRVQISKKLINPPSSVLDNETIFSMIASQIGGSPALGWKGRLISKIAPVELSFNQMEIWTKR